MKSQMSILLRALLLLSIFLGIVQAKTQSISVTGAEFNGYEYDSSKLKSYLDESNQVTINVYNGAWVRNILLPETGIAEHSEVIVNVTSSWAVNVETSSRVVRVHSDKKKFVYINGVWDDRTESLTVHRSLIRSLENNPNKLQSYFVTTRKVIVNIYNGAWTGNIVLPEMGIIENSEIVFNVSSSWAVNVKSSGNVFRIHNEKRKFVYKNGAWDSRVSSIELSGSSLGTVNNNPDKLKDYLKNAHTVVLHLYNGSWIRNIVLPETGILENSEVIVSVWSSWGTNVKTPEKTFGVHRQVKRFVYKNDKWNDLTKPSKCSISMINNKYKISWNANSDMDMYTVYIGATPNVSSTNYIQKIDAVDTSVEINDFATNAKSYYFTVVGKNDNLETKNSDILKVEKYTTSLLNTSDKMDEFLVNKNLKTTALQRLTHKVLSTETIARESHAGYNTTDINVKIEDDNIISISNKTPRKFKNINIVINNVGYFIDEPCNVFQTKRIQISNLRLNLNSKIEFLDPNPMYNFNVSRFTSDTLLERVEMYKLMQSHFKSFYSSTVVRDQFYEFFLTTKEHTQSQMLEKWYTTMTSNRAIEYRANSATAGVASTHWLAIGWPFSFYKENKTYAYIYTVLAHEYAHTMGFSHSSGLAYGWDDYVGRNITELFNNEIITGGMITNEYSDIFWSFDKDKNILTPYSLHSTNFSLNDIHIILPKGNLSSIIVANDKVILGLSKETLDQHVIVNSNILTNGVSNTRMSNYIIR